MILLVAAARDRRPPRRRRGGAAGRRRAVAGRRTAWCCRGGPALLALLALLAIAPPAPAAVTDELTLPSETCRGLFMVPVSVGPQAGETLDMLLDTGASRSYVDPRALRRLLGSDVRAGRVELEDARIGRHRLGRLRLGYLRDGIRAEAVIETAVLVP